NLWFIQAVSMAPLSLVIPVLSLTPVFTALGAYLGLGETLGFQQIAGVILIVVSTFFLGKAESSKTTVNDGSSVKKGVLLMGLVAVMWSITPIFDKICLREVPSSEHGFIQCAGIAIFFGVYLRVRGIPASFRLVSANFEWFSIAVLFASIALFTQLWAIQVVQVGIFEALKRSVGLVAALLLGHFLFAERISRIKVGLVGLIAVGIFVLLV
ncbi:MAG: EamA family transporter, partial [Bdellovibrionota bacterium]